MLFFMTSIGRNYPCPCGSGKKHKKCCLDKAHAALPPAGREEAVRARLVQEVMAFGKRRYMNDLRGAYEFFWDGHEPKEFLRTPEAYNAGSINFFEWVVYDWRPKDDEKTLTEFYAASKKKITPEERGVLDKMGNAHISLYEVQAVYRGFP